jgi:hypothetical protein
MPHAIADYRPPRPPANSGSRAFLLHTDLGMCWCKPLNNPQGPMVPLNEQLCAAWGKLIGAPVCEGWMVEIPGELAGEEIAPGYLLEAGIAHGSAEVADAAEIRGSLNHLGDDSNAVRYAGLFALYDWLWGGDAQWLYSTREQNAYYAHDQGHFFPDGPNWTVDSLNASRELPHTLAQPTAGLDPVELQRLADALGALTAEELRDVLPNFPASWPMDPIKLDTVIDFALHRATGVAQRLRSLIP